MDQSPKKTVPRYKARIAIYNGPNQQMLLTNYSVNMSMRGVFVETDDILPVNSLLMVRFSLPDNYSIITCNARVAWTNEEIHLRKYSIPPGMGLHFLDLSLDNMYAIRDYLNNGDHVPTW